MTYSDELLSMNDPRRVETREIHQHPEQFWYHPDFDIVGVLSPLYTYQTFGTFRYIVCGELHFIDRWINDMETKDLVANGWTIVGHI